MPVMDSGYTSALAGRDMVIKSLYAGLGVCVVAVVVLGWGWMRSAEDVRIFIPPDLAEGVVVGVDEPGPSDVYAFGFYIWQQIYRWPTDGAQDYPARVGGFRAFLTPRCHEELRADAAERRLDVRGRVRSVWAIPGRGYDFDKVVYRGAGRWVVYLDLHLEETLSGTLVKERLVRYPVRVVRYDADREMNPWGLAIDCLDGVATAIGEKE